MEKKINYHGSDVWYSINGEGKALLFLHGYLENSEIWKEFTQRFTNKYKVICIDIPGHGKSDVLGEVHEMDEMARAAKAVLDYEKISSVTVFGHSMGGYVTMEFVNLFPEYTNGYCLFHSTCFSDNEEKKINRDREISLVMCGKKMQIIHTNIPKAFADDQVKKMDGAITLAKKIASANPDAGIIALLKGMKIRQDHSGLMANTKISPLIIWGAKDNYIDKKTFEKMISLAPGASVIILKNSGHMGFLEEPDCVYAGIINYLVTIQKVQE